MTRVVLLGPQKGRPTVGATLRDLGLGGLVATVTAGWQEWEADDRALADDIGTKTLNLALYERAERVWTADPELRAAHGSMQGELRLLRRIYNRRLASLADEWIALLKDGGPSTVLGPERASALEAIRTLDAHHLTRIREIRAAHEHEVRPLERPAVRRERAELERALARVGTVVVAGGHVAVLVNRIALFGLADAFAARTVVACSGAAIALAERVVLFHDNPPWGPGNTEVALPGLGLHRGLVPLPHGAERLSLGRAERVSRLATRLAPSVCVPMGPGSRIDWDGSEWTPRQASRLTEEGRVEAWGSAA